MHTLVLDPSRILLDPARNFSRSGRPHDEDLVIDLAEKMLHSGQITPIEVYPLAFLEGAPREDTPETRALGEQRRAKKLKTDAYGLVSGYRRVLAARYLQEQGETSELWSGKIAAALAPPGLDEEGIQDRNLEENAAREDLTPIDVAVVLSEYTRAPEEGGRGETMELAVKRLRLPGGVAKGNKLIQLCGLVEEARELVRENHHDPDYGIPVSKATTLARRPADKQREIIAEARDAAGRVTPKAIRGLLAPHQGRQGQPPAPSGAALTRLSLRLERTPDAALERAGITSEQRDLLHNLILLLTDQPHKLPASLVRIIEGGLKP